MKEKHKNFNRQKLINAIIDLPIEVFQIDEKLNFIRNLPIKFFKVSKKDKKRIGDYFCYAFDPGKTDLPFIEWDTLRLALENQERKNQGW